MLMSDTIIIGLYVTFNVYLMMFIPIIMLWNWETAKILNGRKRTMDVYKSDYLFNEGVSPEGMISVSQLQTFLSCRKKWEYDYIENIKPRVERPYLTVGKLCHKGMQVAMTSAWAEQMTTLTSTQQWESWRDAGIHAIKDEWEKYMNEVPLLDEEVPDMESIKEDAISVFSQAFEEFEPWKYEVLTLEKDMDYIPALELHFWIPCPPTKGMHGFIDAILRDKETGSIWCTDYKFRKSLSPDEEEALNIQNAVYSYACAKMNIPITGTLTWQHVNTPAQDPKVNKDGSISTAKIKTTWKHYVEFLKNHGEDETKECYAGVQNKLSEIEWFRGTYEYRNEKTLSNIWNECISPVAVEINKARKGKLHEYRSLYPWNCKMCQYQSLCQAELRDYDADAIREREYSRR